MAEKVGFIRITIFDPPAPNEYAAYKKLARRLEPNGKVKTIAETHPLIPPLQTEPPGLNRTPDIRLYKFASELAPWFDEYHARALDISRFRESLKAIERYRFHNEIADLKYFRQVDLLHAWITELLFERVYRQAGRAQKLFEKVAKREWMENKIFREEQREHKIAEVLDERRVTELAKAHTQELRQLLHSIIFEEFKRHIQQQSMARRDQDEHRKSWHLHDVLLAFEKAWMHAWDNQDVFRQLVRHGILQQAEIYPRLLREAINAPHQTHQKLQEHINRERQEMALIKLKAEAGRQLTHHHKAELHAYQLFAAEKFEEQRLNHQWQNHVLIERDSKQRDQSLEAEPTESLSYQPLAGRMVPQPKFDDATDITRIPLVMGLEGDPRVPKHVAPAPLPLVPRQQKELWQKVRSTQDQEHRNFVEERSRDWHEKTQVIRQNMAAIEYGEQKTKEVLRSAAKPVVDVPENGSTVQPVPRSEPIAEPKLAVSTDEPQADGKNSKKKEAG